MYRKDVSGLSHLKPVLPEGPVQSDFDMDISELPTDPQKEPFQLRGSSNHTFLRPLTCVLWSGPFQPTLGLFQWCAGNQVWWGGGVQGGLPDLQHLLISMVSVLQSLPIKSYQLDVTQRGVEKRCTQLAFLWGASHKPAAAQHCFAFLKKAPSGQRN